MSPSARRCARAHGSPWRSEPTRCDRARGTFCHLRGTRPGGSISCGLSALRVSRHLFCHGIRIMFRVCALCSVLALASVVAVACRVAAVSPRVTRCTLARLATGYGGTVAARLARGRVVENSLPPMQCIDYITTVLRPRPGTLDPPVALSVAALALLPRSRPVRAPSGSARRAPCVRVAPRGAWRGAHRTRSNMPPMGNTQTHTDRNTGVAQSTSSFFSCSASLTNLGTRGLTRPTRPAATPTRMTVVCLAADLRTSPPAWASRLEVCARAPCRPHT